MSDLQRFIDYVPTPDYKRMEPALLIRREKSRKAIAIPLSMAHEFTSDDVAIKKAMGYANLLYGGAHTRFDVFKIVDLIAWGLVDLVSAPPPAPPNRQRVEREMERVGLTLSCDGNIIVDATA